MSRRCSTRGLKTTRRQPRRCRVWAERQPDSPKGQAKNGRQEHPGIAGVGDLTIALHGWTPATTAILTLHDAVDVAPEPIPQPSPEPSPEPVETPEPPIVETPENGNGEIPPETGGRALPMIWAMVLMLAGAVTVAASLALMAHPRPPALEI